MNELEKWIERLPVGIVVLDELHAVTSCNEIALQLLDMHIEDALVGRFEDVRLPGELRAALADVAASGRAETFFETGTRYVKATLWRGDAPESPGGLMIVIEDLTSVRRMDGIKREFIATVLHGLRGPLSTLKTSLSMLASDALPMPPQAGEIVLMCQHEANRLHVLVNDLRNLFAVETGLAAKDLDFERFPVVRALDKAVEHLLRLPPPFSGVVGRLSISGEAGQVVRADFEKLTFVITNLLKNALAYSVDGTPVDVDVHRDDGCVSLSFRDRGIGITESARPLVFTKFFREDNAVNRTTDGNGLGLFIAQSLVQLMGGALYFEACATGGSRFVVTLPEAGS